jgi:hypothetical protein
MEVPQFRPLTGGIGAIRGDVSPYAGESVILIKYWGSMPQIAPMTPLAPGAHEAAFLK